MKYSEAPDIYEKVKNIIGILNFSHIPLERISCFRSRGTSTRNAIARCHALPRVMQLGLKTNAFYIIELISERFDKLGEEEQIKVLIHELMHVPKAFGGGFRHHDYVCRREVENMYRQYKKCSFSDGNIFPSKKEKV